mgnify:CR=1 FL=1
MLHFVYDFDESDLNLHVELLLGLLQKDGGQFAAWTYFGVFSSIFGLKIAIVLHVFQDTWCSGGVALKVLDFRGCSGHLA